MRVQVDVELLRATAPPLRRAVEVVDELARGSLRSGSDAVGEAVGDEVLGRALAGFVASWSDQLTATADRSRALAGMLDRAAEHYGHTEHTVHGQARQAGT
jgi:hypothetical protein